MPSLRSFLGSQKLKNFHEIFKLFLLEKGTYNNFIYDGTYLYFDPNKINLMVGMRIYYDSKQLIITSVDGNRIKFTTSDSLSITKNK